MVATFTPEDRAAFQRCRRFWDFSATTRRNLEADEPSALNVDRALRDALAVYYFPGMWDWSRGIVLPLVGRELDRSLGRQLEGRPSWETFDHLTAAAKQLLGAYEQWAPNVERFAPVLVEVDFEADLVDPVQPELGLVTTRGENVRYKGRVDLLAIDEFDAYWIVQHRAVTAWTPERAIVEDEEAVAACWAWEHFYLGMEITGTIHNELLLPLGSESMGETPAPAESSGGLRQSEASGGGRSIPQHRRLYAHANEPASPDPIQEDLGPWFRRTWIRRTRGEIEEAGRQLAIEALEAFDPEVALTPEPSEAACVSCSFAAPCRQLYEGEDIAAMLTSRYRTRASDARVEGRLGGVTWSTGRGAAPPKFSR